MRRDETASTAILIILAAALCLGLAACSSPLRQRSGDDGPSLSGASFGVDVAVAGTFSPRGLIGDSTVASVRISVLDADGERIGSGELAKETTCWRGTIDVTATGPATLKAYGKKDNGSILYCGSASANLSGSGDNVPISVSAVGSVTYDGNGETGGTAPVDGAVYALGDPITTLDQGTLAKTGYAFAGWTTDDSGGGSSHAAGDSFNKGAEKVILYAVWIPGNLTFTSSGTAITITGNTTKPTGALAIRAGVTSIGASAFFQCTGLSSLTLPESISSIGQNAFNQCSALTTLSLPSRLTSLGNYAFMNCVGLTSATVPKSLTSIANQIFSGDYNLTSVTLESGLSVMGTYMFENCSLLTTIAIPSTVASIRNFAFKGCNSLANVTIANGVGTIDQGAFQGCTALGSISIPASITSIGTYAFDGCTILLSVTMASATPPALAGGVQANASTVFQGALSTMRIHVPTAQAVTDYKANTGWAVYGTKIVTP
jgi:uncharacterized repeat protein (TIGR02543 family)